MMDTRGVRWREGGWGGLGGGGACLVDVLCVGEEAVEDSAGGGGVKECEWRAQELGDDGAVEAAGGAQRAVSEQDGLADGESLRGAA